jgi:hypothetical protein
MGKERIRPNVVHRRLSPNRYHPRGAQPSLIVIHSTESPNRKGTSDLEAIGALFASPAREAAAQVCTDGEGQSARYVRDEDAAYACVSYNRVSLNIEQIGYASQEQWPEAQIKETARWVAVWSVRHGIPIRKGRTASGRVLRSGVVTHRSLGSAGGGHWDPGYHYPMKRMLELARHYRQKLLEQS